MYTPVQQGNCFRINDIIDLKECFYSINIGKIIDLYKPCKINDSFFKNNIQKINNLINKISVLIVSNDMP